MEVTFNEMIQMMVDYLPKLLAAVAILVVGWILALVIARLARGILKRTTLDNRLVSTFAGAEKAGSLDVERFTGRVVFYLVMLFVLVAFFQVLGLSLVAQPLNRALDGIWEFLPRFLGAILLLLIAWGVASAARAILKRVLESSGIERRLGGEAGIDQDSMPSLTRSLSETVFWLILLLFLPAVLDALALEGLLEPVQSMLGSLLRYVPNILAAGLTLLVGWFLARILQRVVGNLLQAAGIDRLGEQVGLSRALGNQRPSGLVGLIVYVLVLIPVVVAALDALQMDAVSRPASQVLNQILSVIPSVFAAAVVVTIAYVVGRLVAGLVTNLLSGTGFNAMVARLGLGKEAEGRTTPAEIVGFVVLVAIMLLAGMEAFRLAGFPLLADLVARLNVFAGNVLIGLLIFAAGLFLSMMVHDKIASSSGANARFLALIARISILVVTVAMGIQQMGVGGEITRLVLALILGALAIAAAIAFGLGSRDVAGRLVEEWVRGMRSGGDSRQ